MMRPALLRSFPLFSLAALLPCTPAQALFRFNDGHDKVFVTGTASIGWDSNLFANRYSQGDTTFTYGLAADYERRAGAIGVGATLGAKAHQFAHFKSEDSFDPYARLEFTKSGGRTTGSFLLDVSRRNEVDTSANARNRSWNYAASLNAKYPVIERYSFTGGLGWERNNFLDNSAMVDLRSWYARTDLFYALNSQRDLYAGYRFRHDLTSGLNGYNDHDFHLGVKGRILPKLNGSLTLGYQVRTGTRTDTETYHAWSGAAISTWHLSKRLSLTGQVVKDFRTTASDDATDVLSGSLQLTRIFTTRWSLGTGLGGGHTRYLGAHGKGREDTFVSWQAELNYSMNDHLKVSGGYVYLSNWSGLSYADYHRNSFHLSFSSRW